MKGKKKANVAREVSAGAIIFYSEKGKIYYLILYRAPHGNFKEYYGFVQGNVEKGEEARDTVLREAREEAGLDIKLIPNFKEKIHYFYQRDNKTISKDVIFFLAEAKTNKVKLSEEHDGYFWLTYDEALKKLRFKNQKEILAKANEFITKATNSAA
ncbi:MAG: NUDIX domain-containing protein [Candidatus Pacearchaeota archaeon]